MHNEPLINLYDQLITEEFGNLYQQEMNFEQPQKVEPVNTPDFKIEKWKGGRNFALYLNGELLAIVVYKKGANAIINKIKELYSQAA